MAFMLALALALTGMLGIAQAQQKFTAKIADILSPDHPHSLTMKFYADRVKERTKGRMEIQVFHSAQLGQTKDRVLVGLHQRFLVQSLLDRFQNRDGVDHFSHLSFSLEPAQGFELKQVECIE